VSNTFVDSIQVCISGCEESIIKRAYVQHLLDNLSKVS